MPPKIKLMIDGQEVSKGQMDDAMDRFRKIGVSASLKQLSKLRNGHKVRLTSGEGCLMVDPSRYDTLAKTFMRGKGMSVQLSPEEIAANRAVMAGEGIFGPGFDSFLKKIGIKKQVYKFGDMIKGPVKKAINAFVDKAPAALGAAGATLATAVGQPELAPLAIKAGQELGKKARNYTKKHLTGKSGYLDNPEAYQKNPKKFADFKGVGLKEDLSNSMRHRKRSAVTLAQAQANNDRYMLDSSSFGGSGLYAGGGLYAGFVTKGRGMSIVGARQSMMGNGHPAMESQPLSTHFHQQFQLPPQFQKFHQQGAGFIKKL